MRKLVAAVAAMTLAVAPAGAQPPQTAEPPQQEEASRNSEISGGLWAYLALPVMVVLALLIAVAAGEDEPDSP